MPSLYRALGYSALSWLFLAQSSFAQPKPSVLTLTPTAGKNESECSVQGLPLKSATVIRTILLGLCVGDKVIKMPDGALEKIQQVVLGLKDKVNVWNPESTKEPLFDFAFPEGEKCKLPKVFKPDQSIPLVSKVIEYNYIRLPEQIATKDIQKTVNKFATQIDKSIEKNEVQSMFTTCLGDEAVCQAIRKKLIGGTKYGFSNDDDVTATDIAFSLACSPRFQGAIPRFADNTGGGKSTCACVCPAGEKFNADFKCIAVEDPLGNAECKPCVIKKTDELNLVDKQSTCSIGGVSNQFIVPSPWDNYVFNEKNQKPASIAAKWQNEDKRVSVSEKKFEWTNFDTGNTEWTSFLTFPDVGRYRLTVTASDYYGKAVCETLIMIQDNIAPKGDKNFCTAALSPPISTDINAAHKFNQVNLNKVLESLKNVRKFVTDAIKSNCGDGTECNKYRTSANTPTSKQVVPSGFDQELSSDADIDQFFKLDAKDLAYLKKISNTIMDDTPGKPILKCRGLGALLGKKRTEYLCGPTPSVFPALEDKHCFIPNQLDALSVADGRACETIECLRLEGNEFYTATIDTVGVSETIVLKVPGKVVGVAPDGVIRLDLATVITCVLGFTPFAGEKNVKYDASEDDFTGTTIDDIVKCRYNIGKGYELWDTSIGAKIEETFTEASSTVLIECYTVIGLIQRKEIIVQVTPTSDIDVSEEFARIAWTQSGSTQIPFVSYPHSDFADLTFFLPHDFGNGTIPAGFKFESVDCSAVFKNEDQDGRVMTEPKALLSYKRMTEDITKHFSVDLVKDEMTEKLTTVVFTCKLNFKNEKNWEKSQVIDTTITFKDIDNPLFPKDESIFDCVANGKCADKIQPFGYCGKNFIWYTAPRPGASVAAKGVLNFREDDSKQACCTDCGDYVCSKLYDGDETLKQCTVPVAKATATVALVEHGAMVDHRIISSSNLFSLSGAMMISVFAAVGMVVGKFIALKTNQKNDTDNTGYAPLL